jgi:serine/threonine protein kinase
VIEEMLCGQVKYPGKSELDMLVLIFTDKGTPTPQTLTDYNDFHILRQIGTLLPAFRRNEGNMFDLRFGYGFDRLIDWCTEIDPKNRPTA